MEIFGYTIQLFQKQCVHFTCSQLSVHDPGIFCGTGKHCTVKQFEADFCECHVCVSPIKRGIHLWCKYPYSNSKWGVAILNIGDNVQ